MVLCQSTDLLSLGQDGGDLFLEAFIAAHVVSAGAVEQVPVQNEFLTLATLVVLLHIKHRPLGFRRTNYNHVVVVAISGRSRGRRRDGDS